MSEKKAKLHCRLTPIMSSETIMAHDNYNGSELGKLLFKIKPQDSAKFYIGRDKQEYIRGLRDAGVMSANRLYDMLCKTDRVEVEFFEQETEL